MATLCQLIDPEHYRASEWNIAADARDRDYLLGLFETFPAYIEPLLRADAAQAGPDFEAHWPVFTREWATGMAEIREQAEHGRSMMTIELTRYRNSKLRKYGWIDPYRQVKALENALAAELFASVVSRIDAAAPGARWELLIRGLFAGNMFDLGSPKTIEMYHSGQLDFATILQQVPQRPWFIDQADALVERLGPPARYRQALIFVDNAGTDIVLGVVPVAREMARAGMRVVLAANDGPALNDITAAELRPLLAQLAGKDALLGRFCREDRITVVGSGGDTPLIDLGHVSDECNTEAARSDLLVLEGMGRGVESNWDRRFKCDSWRVALLKDESVVRYHRAKLFDAVCRWEPGMDRKT